MGWYTKHNEIKVEIEKFGYDINQDTITHIITLNKDNQLILTDIYTSYSELIEKLYEILIYVKRIEKLKRLLDE